MSIHGLDQFIDDQLDMDVKNRPDVVLYYDPPHAFTGRVIRTNGAIVELVSKVGASLWVDRTNVVAWGELWLPPEPPPAPPVPQHISQLLPPDEGD